MRSSYGFIIFGGDLKSDALKLEVTLFGIRTKRNPNAVYIK